MQPLKEDSVFRRTSHNYELTKYTINETGLVKSDKVLELDLVKGSKETNEVQEGYLVEQLLWVSLNYLTEVNVGDLRSRDTSIAITHIEDALLRINKRTLDRVKRKVITTYKK